MEVKIDENVPMSEDSDAGFMVTLEAAAGTARLLESAGLGMAFDDDDIDDAAAIARQAARAPQSLMTKAAKHGLTKKTPASLLLTQKILDDYGHQIVQEAAQVRHMVVNKLIQETDNPDGRVRMKALELLGKVSDVSLFTEKQEITVTHQTTDDLRAKLRKKLEAMKADTFVDEADFVDVTPETETEDGDDS